MGSESFHNVCVGGIEIGRECPLVLIAGCCAIESEKHALTVCERLVEITSDLQMPYVFKASFDKANRNAITSYRGPGMAEGLRILAAVKARFNVPILTDVHEIGQVAAAADVAEILQIPAFLSRQTDLVVAAARSGRVVNIKKGQFMAPWDIGNIIGKAVDAGSDQILLTERGVSFGYNRLVADMTALPILRGFGYPVVFDATHSVQQPAGQGGCSGGAREMIPALTRAACAVGIDALFMETHPHPDQALCDGPNSWPLDAMADLLRQCQAIDRLVDESQRRLSE